ncbi:tetratricopeptide repeat protein [Gloeothece verrucosa]|uniref:NB-ARC domain protein n=1 Tax=Gloeothece verrucosa (strain PCC 7822) TaxID=497965 RepID=E0UHN6_GLOV7|nr:tetratricopeptide repeat protein [Gloeothece verrucosa]ADN13293.1 NB-ARC domain protein [Gloeothece verrucosa PCC 7822]
MGSRHFVGRERELLEIHTQLQLEGRLAICAIAGMGGVGKTELVTQYALQYQQDYQGGICWLDGRGVELGTQLVNYAQVYLNVNPPDELEIGDKVRYCWRNWFTSPPTPLHLPLPPPARGGKAEDSFFAGEGSNYSPPFPRREGGQGGLGQALIIYDDVQDYHEVIPYLPPSPSQFKVLLTSRNRPGVSIPRIELDVLSKDAAIKLLRSLVGDARIEAELEQVQELCEKLGYLPLGLELVGKYLDEHRGLTIKELIKRLKKKGLDEKALNPSDTAFMTAQRGVKAAMELSWEDLSSEAKKLACFLSLFAASAIKWEWVEKCLLEVDSVTVFYWEEFLETSDKDEDAYQEKLRELQQYLGQQGEEFNDFEEVEEWLENWIEEKQEALENFKEELRDNALVNRSLLEERGNNQYQLHPLLREFFQIKLKDLEEADDYKQKLCKIMVSCSSSLSQTPTLTEIKAVTEAIPHLIEVANNLIDWLGNQEEELVWIFEGLIRFYEGQGTYIQAERWSKQCLQETKKRFGINHPSTAMSLTILSGLYRSQGRFTEAETLLQQALDINQRLLEIDHPDTATSLDNLAVLYSYQGRFMEAEPLLKQALEILQRVLGIDHPSTAMSLNNLAYCYYCQGRFNEAEPLYIQALKITQKVLGIDHPSTAMILNNLAYLYSCQGRSTEAKPLLKQALEIRQRVLGIDHPDTAMSLNNLAGLYDSQRRFTEAENLYQQALEIRQKVLGIDHPDTAMSLNNLAYLYYYQGRLSEAEPLYLQALEIKQKVLGIDHPSTATSLNNLALLYDSQGRLTEAEPLYLQALEIRQKVLGIDYPDTAQSLNNLAGLYKSQGRLTEAAPLYLQALEIVQRTLGEDHPTTQTIAANYQYCLMLMLFTMPVEEALKRIPEEYHQDFLQQREEYLKDRK